MRRMLRFTCMLLAMLLLCSAALCEEALRGYDKKDGYVYLTLGAFPQTKDGGELPILWRVLSVEDGRAYILSEYVLEARRVHGDYQEYANKPNNKKKPGFDGDFAQTELSLYMNGEFMSHFSAGELLLTIPHETMGTFFLVTAEDLKNKALGFGTNQSRKAWGTEYAVENGLFVYLPKYGEHSPYWTCDQSTSDARHARCIKDEGELGRINVITEDEGMRPACYLDMAKIVIASGTGTMEDPFVLKTGEPIVAAPIQAEVVETAPVTECNCAPEGEKCDCCDCCSCSRR